jgi:hypothetical protein
MRDAQSGPSSAACPASAKSATHSFNRGLPSPPAKRRRSFARSGAVNATVRCPGFPQISTTVGAIITIEQSYYSVTLLLLSPTSVTRYKTHPPWEFLLSASRNSLQSYELTRLSHAANLRKEINALLDQWLEENASAMLARWLMEQRARPSEIDAAAPRRGQTEWRTIRVR